MIALLRERIKATKKAILKIILNMSFLRTNVVSKENVKVMPQALAGIFCFICSKWTSLKIVRTTMTNGEKHYEDVCDNCEDGMAYFPFDRIEMESIKNSLKTIGVSRKQVETIICMIKSNDNTKFRFNQSFGSIYTEVLLDSARKREKSDEPEECFICLEIPEIKKELKCSHIVCEACYEKIDKERCPMCRCYFEWNGDLDRILY
jgi:hypothetical protein